MNRRPDASVLDRYFRSLAHERRRCALSYLIHEGDGSATVEELVEYVVEAEAHSPSPDPRSVRITLAHTHLPMLADQGLLEYDRDRGVVRSTGRTDQLVPYLDVVEDLEFSDAV